MALDAYAPTDSNSSFKNENTTAAWRFAEDLKDHLSQTLNHVAKRDATPVQYFEFGAIAFGVAGLAAGATILARGHRLPVLEHSQDTGRVLAELSSPEDSLARLAQDAGRTSGELNSPEGSLARLAQDTGRALGELGSPEGSLARPAQEAASALDELGRLESGIARVGDDLVRARLQVDAAGHLLMGRNDQALASMDQLVKLNEHDHTAFLQRAEVHQSLGDQAAADQDYLQFARLLAQNTVLKGNPSLSREQAARVANRLHLVPASADVVREYDAAGHTERLLSGTQRRIIEFDHDLFGTNPPLKTASTLISRAGAYQRLGHYALAMTDLEESDKLAGPALNDSRDAHNFSYRWFQQRSSLHEALGDTSQADADYLESTRVLANQAVLEVHSRPSLSGQEVSAMVDELHLVPSSAAIARDISETSLSDTLRSLVRDARDLARPTLSNLEKAQYLEGRGIGYSVLGHHDLALRDFKESLASRRAATEPEYRQLVEQPGQMVIDGHIVVNGRRTTSLKDIVADAENRHYQRITGWMAKNAVLAGDPTMSREAAYKMADELHLVPLASEAAKDLDQVALSQAEIVRHPGLLRLLENPLTNAERALAFETLGHDKLALADLNRSLRWLGRQEHKEPYADYEILMQRSRVQEKLGSEYKAGAAADYLEATARLGYKAVMAFHPEMTEEQAGKLVGKLNLIPASAEAGRAIGGQLGRTQFDIVDLSKRLSSAAHEQEAGSILEQRAKLYADLGHNNIARKDREESARLLASYEATLNK